VIKISKDLNKIPETLIKGQTLSKRSGVIAQKIFPTSNKSSSKKEKKKAKVYADRFRTKDIKDSLEIIYNKKCAYCEQTVIRNSEEQTDDKSTIEHYRPKSKYYWLAYSWDNLLWCCHKCNENKDNAFNTKNPLVFNSITFKRRIHKATKTYNRIEKPKMINPEIESVIKKLDFDNGVISSSDMRIKYTIETCGLDRENLNERRKKIIDVFVKKIKDRRLANKPIDDIVKDLKSDIISKDKEFIALRLWLLINYTSLIKPK